MWTRASLVRVGLFSVALAAGGAFAIYRFFDEGHDDRIVAARGTWIDVPDAQLDAREVEVRTSLLMPLLGAGAHDIVDSLAWQCGRGAPQGEPIERYALLVDAPGGIYLPQWRVDISRHGETLKLLVSEGLDEPAVAGQPDARVSSPVALTFRQAEPVRAALMHALEPGGSVEGPCIASGLRRIESCVSGTYQVHAAAFCHPDDGPSISTLIARVAKDRD